VCGTYLHVRGCCAIVVVVLCRNQIPNQKGKMMKERSGSIFFYWLPFSFSLSGPLLSLFSFFYFSLFIYLLLSNLLFFSIFLLAFPFSFLLHGHTHTAQDRELERERDFERIL
jgi:hypothetical protein